MPTEIAGVINVNVIGASNSAAAVIPGHGGAAKRAVGGDIEFGRLPWLAEVGRLLRQQSRGFSVLRKSAAGSNAKGHCRYNNSSWFHQNHL